MMDDDLWVSLLKDARRFDSQAEAQARLDQVGEKAWGRKVQGAER